jgi:DNA polymerase III epsilon subunit-like protein
MAAASSGALELEVAKWAKKFSEYIGIYVVYDLETTGRSWKACWLVQISARIVYAESGLPAPDLAFDRFVMPPSSAKISPQAKKVHKLDRAILRSEKAKETALVLSEFVSFVEDAAETCGVAGKHVGLVAYNGHGFDARILLRLFDILERDGAALRWPKNWRFAFDPLALLNRLAPRGKSIKLTLHADVAGRQFASPQESEPLTRVAGESFTLSAVYRKLAGQVLQDAHDTTADTSALVYIFRALLWTKVKKERIKSIVVSIPDLRCRMEKTKDFEFVGTQAGDVNNDSEHEGDVLIDVAELCDMGEDSGDDEQGQRELTWQEIVVDETNRLRAGRKVPMREPEELKMPFVHKHSDGTVDHRDQELLALQYATPSEAFLHFFQDALRRTVVETNRYARQRQETEKTIEDEERRVQQHEKRERAQRVADKRRREGREGRKRKSRRASSSSSSNSSTTSSSTKKKKKRRRGRKSGASSSSSSSSHRAQWKDVGENEMKTFLSTLIMLGTQQRRSRRRELFSKDVLDGELFMQALFTRDRWEAIWRFLHFANNGELLPRGHDNFDPLGKIRPIIDSLNEKFRSSYDLRVYVSGDECSCGFCGRCGFRKSMAHKPIAERFGINIYAASCALTSFLYQFEPWHANFLRHCQLREPRLAHIDRVNTMALIYLLRDVFNRPHKPVIVCDRLYCSLNMASHARKLGFEVIGTTRSNSSGTPPKKEHLKDRQVGQVKFWRAKVQANSAVGNLRGAVVLNYVDSRAFLMLTTIAEDRFQWDKQFRPVLPSANRATLRRRDKGEIVERYAPLHVLMYNATMNGVDWFDQNCSRWKIGFRRTRKWTVVLYCQLVDFAIENARIAYNFFKEPSGRLNALDFRRRLAVELLTEEERDVLRHLSTAFSGLVDTARSLRSRHRRMPMHTISAATPPPSQQSLQLLGCCNLVKIRQHAAQCYFDGCTQRTRQGCSFHDFCFCSYAHFVAGRGHQVILPSRASRQALHSAPPHFHRTQRQSRRRKTTKPVPPDWNLSE